MSRMVGLALLLALRAEASGAQDARTLARTVDSLQAVAARAEQQLATFDHRVRVRHLQRDTIVVAPLRLLVEEGLGPMAATAAMRAVDTVNAIAGAAVARLDPYFIVLTRDSSARPRSRPIHLRVLLPSGQEGIAEHGPANAGGLANALTELALRTVAGSLDSTFRRWTAAEIRWDSMPSAAWINPRLVILGVEAPVARSCYAGDIPSCASLLGLAGEPPQRWHGPLRATLARVAVQLGGNDGFERLMTASGPPPERLVAAAGVPMDSIVRAWHARVSGARAPSSQLDLGIAASAMAWILVLGAASLRSSRWR